MERAEARVNLLSGVNKASLNRQGLKEYNYQLGTEKFIISFFNNHHNMHQAYQLLKNGNIEEALPYIKKTNPEETLALYAETVADYGVTIGEQGILLSMNLRWLPDYIDNKELSSFSAGKSGREAKTTFVLSGGALSLKVIPYNGLVKLTGLVLNYKATSST